MTFHNDKNANNPTNKQMEKEYKKSIDDEIDWKLIDQLHTATLHFSSTSLELKKIYFVLVGIAVPTLIKLASDKLDLSLFITLYLLTVTFWFLDSFTYFHQEKLREKMDKIFSQIKRRNQNKLIVSETFTIESSRTSKHRLLRSMFNYSVGLYIILFSLNSITLLLYFRDIIR
ncbi:MAG: hypothetical protein LBJ67_08410 [Planctomycetaceae bacterium]|nr:hypothetical protein [Planctomycetaceae bacterium]